MWRKGRWFRLGLVCLLSPPQKKTPIHSANHLSSITASLSEMMLLTTSPRTRLLSMMCVLLACFYYWSFAYAYAYSLTHPDSANLDVLQPGKWYRQRPLRQRSVFVHSSKCTFKLTSPFFSLRNGLLSELWTRWCRELVHKL